MQILGLNRIQRIAGLPWYTLLATARSLT